MASLSAGTMGCIRVDRITEYLCEPLGKALKDKVRFQFPCVCCAFLDLH